MVDFDFALEIWKTILLWCVYNTLEQENDGKKEEKINTIILW